MLSNVTTRIEKIFALVFIFLYTQLPAVKAQVNADVPTRISSYDIYDSTYINAYPSKWSVRVYSASKYQQFHLVSQSIHSQLKYTPNKTYVLGVGVTYRRFSLDLGLSAFNSHPYNDKEHETSSGDFIGSLYSRSHLFEMYIQYAKGMFGKDVETGLLQTPESPYFFRPDLRTFNLGLDYNHLFNSKRITLSSLTGTEIQKKSAGGLMIGTFFSSYALRADSSLVPDTLFSSFEEHIRITDAYIFSAGIDAGFAYTLVLPAHFYITISAAPGISGSFADLKANNTWTTSKDAFHFSYKLLVRSAVGYGGKKFYSVLALVYDKNFINTGHSNYFIYDITKVKLVFGYRI